MRAATAKTKVRSHPVRHPLISSYHLIAQCHLSDFYNYFQHGLDFLLSDNTHVVKKIILHTNVVSTIFVVFPLLPYPYRSRARPFSSGTNDVHGRSKVDPRMTRMVCLNHHPVDGRKWVYF